MHCAYRWLSPYFWQKLSLLMENAINFLRIQNFKSIKDVTLHPRRVNLIIGEPNVGKSNLLEAMSLLGASLYSRGAKFLDSILRYETISNLFYDNDNSQPIIVKSSGGQAVLQTQNSDGTGYHYICISQQVFTNYKDALQVKNRHLSTYDAEKEDVNKLLRNLDSKNVDIQDAIHAVRQHNSQQAYFFGYRIQEDGSSSVLGTEYFVPEVFPKSYRFQSRYPHNASFSSTFLEPPFGSNLSSVIQRNISLRKEIAALFKRYDLNLVLRVSERKFEIQKQVGDLIYNYPYSSIADTLQRIIFYLAAIESNDDAVLLFEEPEAHSFPVYVSKLGRRIVESRTNQFFIDTHSPYLVTEILEEMLTDEEQAGDLAMFAAYYEDHQTKIHQLSDEEIRSIRADGIDVFYNMKRFTTGAANA